MYTYCFACGTDVICESEYPMCCINCAENFKDNAVAQAQSSFLEQNKGLKPEEMRSLRTIRNAR